MATYRNACKHLPARMVWVQGKCLFPGQTITLPGELDPEHPEIRLGFLRRIDKPVAAPVVAEPVNAPNKSDLWKAIKAAPGGVDEFKKTGKTYQKASAEDMQDYLKGVG